MLATETIGAAQRGGSVVSHLRIADQVLYSPLVPYGRADYIVGFEPIELMRQIRRLSQDGEYILNAHPVPTVGCNMGLDRYPTLAEIVDALDQRQVRGHVIQATEAASEIGDPLLMNMVMIGALCAVSPFFALDRIKELVAEGSHKAPVEANLAALDAGRIWSAGLHGHNRRLAGNDLRAGLVGDRGPQGHDLFVLAHGDHYGRRREGFADPYGLDESERLAQVDWAAQLGPDDGRDQAGAQHAVDNAPAKACLSCHLFVEMKRIRVQGNAGKVGHILQGNGLA